MSGSDDFLHGSLAGPGRFARKIQYNHKMQKLRTPSFTLLGDDYNDFLNFSFAEQRFKTRTGPLPKIVMKLEGVFVFRLRLPNSNDDNLKEIKAWTCAFVSKWCGMGGSV